MKTARTPRQSLIFLLILYAGWALYFVAQTSFETPDGRVFCLWDDAMISMQYARNFAEGQGLVWNVDGPKVQGISNPAVTLMMAGFHFFPIAPRSVSLFFQLLNLAVLLGILMATFSLSQILLQDRTRVSFAVLWTTMLSGPLALWALRGSDMGFVTLWLLLGVRSLAQVEYGQGKSLTARFVALAPGLWIRPDVALFYGLLLFAAFRIGQRRAAALGAASAALVLGIWLGAGWVYYGDLLPNTYYLKATGHPRGLVLAKGVELVGQWAPALVLPIFLSAGSVWRHRTKTTYQLLGTIPLVSVAYSIWVGGDWMASHGVRFMVPMLPMISFLMMEEVDFLLSQMKAPFFINRKTRAVLIWILATGLGVLANPPAARAEWLTGATPQLLAYNRSNYFLARYLKQNTDPTTSVGVYWAGVPIYFSERQGVDVLGKSDAHIARLQVDRFKPGHSKWDWDYMLSTVQPDIFVDDFLGLARHPIFRNEYLRVEKGNRFFFMRRDAIEQLQDPATTLIDLNTGRTLNRDEVLRPSA